MITATKPSAPELVANIVDVLDEVRSTDGIPNATEQRCEHSLNSVHESLHGLSLWLRELLEWAPLPPETRARVIRLSQDIGDADSRFHRSAEKRSG